MTTKRNEMLEKQAKAVGLDLNYEPVVQMEDIRLLPESFWHKSRQTGWGGSDEAVLNSLNPYCDMEAAFLGKTLGIKSEVKPDKQFIFDFGHAMEPVMLKYYAAKNGYKFLTYNDYFVIVESNDDVTAKFPELKKAMEGVYSNVFRDEQIANELLAKVKAVYPNAYIEVQESNEPKDVRDITADDHAKYDAQGIVCVDRRQYRHPNYQSMIGDMDGLAIDPEGHHIGLECKTYGHLYKSLYASGVLGEDGKIKNPEYAYQVQHYMAVENLDRFDIIACCGNNVNDLSIVTVNRNPQMEKMICDNCDALWEDVKNDKKPIANKLTDEQYENLINLIGNPKFTKPDPIDLPDDAFELLKEYEQRQEVINAQQSAIDDLESKQLACVSKIIHLMGNSAEGTYQPAGENYHYSVKNNRKMETSVDPEELKAKHPEAYISPIVKTEVKEKVDCKKLKAKFPEIYEELKQETFKNLTKRSFNFKRIENKK